MISEVKVVIQNRDQQILDLLRDQGFATFDDLNRFYFNGRSDLASRRLSRLVHSGYLEKKSLRAFFGDNGSKYYFPYILETKLDTQTIVYSLSRAYRKLFQDTSAVMKLDMVLHQIFLTKARLHLEKNLSQVSFYLSDPQSKRLSDVKAGRPISLTPDISIESKRFTVAVEMERTTKNRNRYLERMSAFRTSIYHGVLYYYLEDNTLQILKTYAGVTRKFGFAHIARPNQIFSNAFGYLELNDWFNRIEQIKSTEQK